VYTALNTKATNSLLRFSSSTAIRETMVRPGLLSNGQYGTADSFLRRPNYTKYTAMILLMRPESVEGKAATVTCLSLTPGLPPHFRLKMTRHYNYYTSLQ